MLVTCPECGKKNMTRSEQSITSHVYKSNIHKAMTKAAKSELYRKMIPRFEVGPGSMGRDTKSREYEKSMVNSNKEFM